MAGDFQKSQKEDGAEMCRGFTIWQAEAEKHC